MATWLKLGYYNERRDNASYWKEATWISDSPGRSSSRWKSRPRPRKGTAHPPYGPHYAVGDHLVMYLTGVNKCPAILEVTEEPRWDPDAVDQAWGGEGDRWGVVTSVRVVGALDLVDAPSLERIGVPRQAVQQHGHLQLSSAQYREAAMLILGGQQVAEANGGLGEAIAVPIEAGHVEGYDVASRQIVARAERREFRLVRDYVAALAAQGDDIMRYRLPVDTGSLYCDVFNETRRQLIEAKASTDRGSVRMAIGQLADYARFFEPRPSLAVLVDARPNSDLVALLESQQISVVWREGKTFSDNAAGAFV